MNSQGFRRVHRSKCRYKKGTDVMKRKIVWTLAACSPQTGLRRGWLTALIASLLFSVFAPWAFAQGYPDKPVRLVVAFPAGGPA